MGNNNKTTKKKTNKRVLQKNTARLALFTAFFLSTLKFIFAGFTGSMAILASAMDSLMDIAASGINFFSIRKSLEPADYDHQYGHGKAESLAGFVQSLLMLGTSVYVIYSSVQKFFKPMQIERINIGMLVMFFSTVVSYLLYRKMIQVARMTESVALKADSLHYLTDVLTNMGVAISLWLVHLTGKTLIDLIISIAIAIYIAFSAFQVLKESIDILMDRSLPQEKLDLIHEIISKYYPKIQSYHKLRTRKAGHMRFIDLHVVMPDIDSLCKAHEIAEKLILDLQKEFSNAQVNIHLDPKDDKHEPTNKGGGIHSTLGQE